MKSLVVLSLALFLGFVLSASAQSSFTNGLVASYPFNGNTADATSNSPTGNFAHISYVTNRYGFPTNSVYLNGGNASVGIPYSTNFNILPTGQFTLSAWFRPDGLGSGTGGIGRLVVKGPASGSWDFGLECGLNNQLQIWGGLNNQYPVVSPIILTPGTWHQAVLTYSNQFWSLYLDGALTSQAQTSYRITQSTGGIGIGTKGDQGADFFHGAIDDVAIYNRALATNEVHQIYQAEAPPFNIGIRTAIELDFFAALGATYQLQSSSDLTNWTNVGTSFPGNNELIQQFFPSTNGPQFYRAVLTP